MNTSNAKPRMRPPGGADFSLRSDISLCDISPKAAQTEVRAPRGQPSSVFVRFALLLALTVTAHAGEAPTQPLLLPMEHLLKRLDQSQEWMLVPLADYRALMATITTKEPTEPGLLGARIATEHLSGTLADDRVLTLSGTLVIDAQGSGPHRCRIFGTKPTRLSAISCNGQPAVTVEAGNALDLLMPGPGRHQVTLSWGIDLAGDDQKRQAILPLPYAGAVALTIDAATAGSFTNGHLVADPAQAGRWRLTGGASVHVPLIWEPGRVGSDAQAVFGVEQMVQAAIIDGPASLRWVARLINRRGLMPERLEVILPSGWRLTQAASPGVLAIAEQPDGHVRLTLAPGTSEVACDGLRAADAPLALPQIVGAAYQGGVLMIGGGVPFDLQAPPSWRRLDDVDGWWRFAVPAPGLAVSPLTAENRWGMDVQSSASIELTDGRRPWTMVQSIALADRGGDLGEIALQLPAGWSLTAIAADQPVRIRQLAGGGEVADLPAGSALTLVPQAVRVRALKMTLTLSRSVNVAEAVAATVATNSATVLPVLVTGGRRASHRLSLLSTAPIETRITAGVPWRMASGDVTTTGKNLPVGALRADLLATGAPTPVQVTVSRLVPEVGAEAVLYLAPGLRDDHWCRIDLRLSVRSGEVEILRLVAPLLNDARVQVLSPAVTREVEAQDLRLRARVPLIGDHLLRIEGALDPAKLGNLSRLTLTLGDDLVVPVRQVVVVQAPPQADLVLSAGPGALTLAVDALPAWSRPLPGIPVSVAWRLTSGETGGYRLERRELASAPAGFIDQVVARTQVDPSGTLTLLTARVAAPAVQALPLVVPRGLILVQATIDGQEVAVRSTTTGGYELPLPGRTQVQVALLFRGEVLHDIQTVNYLRLPLPRLGDLPATASSWTVAVSGGWRAQVVEDPAAMPLIAEGQTVGRPWLGSWWEAPVEHRVPVLPPVIALRAPADARALSTVAVEPPATGEPQLVLRGHLFNGTRLGGEVEARLHLTALSTLRAWDHVGRVLAIVLALLLTWRLRMAVRVSIGLAALLLAGALHEWQITVGPLLALAEWLAPALVVVGVVCALVRLRPSPRAAAPLAALLALAMNLSAGDATLVLMGYQKLDPAGVPQDVKVALTRMQLTELYRRAQGEAPANAVCDLATGTPRFELRFVDGHLLGTMSLAVAVPGTTWQQVRIPVAAGSVKGVSARPLGGKDPGTVAWAGDANGALVLTLAPRQQADVVIELDIPMTKAADEWATTFPLPYISGGSLVLEAPRELVPWSGGRALIADGDRWRQDLPVGAAQVALSLRRPQAAVARDLRLGVDQRVRVQTHHDRLEWSAVLTCTAQGGTVRRLVLVVPDGLALTNVEGDGVADWSQRGTQAEIIAASERSGNWTIRLAGVLAITAGAAQERAVLLRVDGAERISGRLDLVGGAGLRFDRPTGERSERVDPLEGADQAVRWSTDPGALAVRWRAVDDELSATVRAVLVVGIDRVRVHAALDLTGPGRRDALRLRIPASWEVVNVPAGTQLVWREVDGQRECTLRTAKPWAAGTMPEIHLEAERRVLGTTISAPDLRPLDGSITSARQVWLFAGAGDRRVRLDEHERQQAMGVEAARGVLANLAKLGAGERWLQACSWRGDGGPRLTLVADDALVRLSASHYVVLGQDRVRWSAHLVHQAEQGELTTLRCTLPATARLVRVNAEGLGTWTLTGRELTVTLAAPTRAVIPLDLELEIPLTGDVVTIDGLVLPGGSSPQDVALVEEDDLGLVHLDAQGLDAIVDRAVPFSLPIGIEAAAVRHRWRSLRPQWSLAIRREALATTASIDNVVTLVDVVSVLGVDGECRGRAVWQVLNRTRTHLTVTLPAGVELWEARVAGVDVRPRRGAKPNEVVLPVTPQRPGESAQAISLTWRERIDTRRAFSPGLPRFSELKIMQGLWRVVPPPGYELKRRDGTLDVVDPVEIEASRAQNVIDELKRLRTLGDLDDVGLKRLGDQLVTLDLQLSDNLISLQQVEVQQAQTAEQQAFNSRVINDVNGNRGELQRELKRIDGVRTSRGERRGKLGLDKTAQEWEKAAAAPSSVGTYAARPSLPLVDRKPQRLAPDASLGAGQPPPGNRVEDQRALLGLDLLGDPGAGGLTLRGQTNDLRLELSMTRSGGAVAPWLLALGSLLVLIGGAWFARRR
jgi:hypothetical protein